MNTLYFQYILTIAEAGSINKASMQLNLKQQYLSYVVKSVENEFNIKIFRRHSRGISITEDGHLFLNYAKQIISILNQMHLQYQYPSKQKSVNKKGVLNLYLPSTLYPITINKAITIYYKYFPNFKINYVENFLEDSIPLILEETYSISLRFTLLSIEELQETLPLGLKIIRLGPANLVALTRKREGLPKTISPQELLQKDFLIFAPEGLERSTAYRILSKYGKFNTVKTIKNNLAFVNLLENENYYSIGLSKIYKNNKNIVSIPLTGYTSFSLSAIAILREDLFSEPIIRDFINILLMQMNEFPI